MWPENEDALTIKLPPSPPDPANSVIILELKGKLDMTDPPVIESAFDILVDSLKVSMVSDVKMSRSALQLTVPSRP